MKRKRFKHHVDIFCDMFCGWRLANCYDRLVEMGSGVYEIDVLTEQCAKDGAPIEPLSIAGELAYWFRADTEAEGISLTSIRTARLRAKLSIERLAGRRRTNVIFPGREEADYIRCHIECESVLESDDDRYEARKQDYEEWPYPLSQQA
jgi:hypothetical protein